MEKRKTILIVDDVPDEIVVVEEILKNDYQIKAVTNGEAALKIVANEAPDLILLDIMMPGMDGFEVCRRLKQDSAGATIPVIFLTAKAKSADESMGLQVGAVDYIRKPVDPDIVRKRIKAHLEMKDEALRISEVRYRRLFETSKTGIMIVDAATGKIIDINPALVEMLGCSQEFFFDENLWDIEFLKIIIGKRERLPEMLNGEYIRHKDNPLDTPDGRSIFLESMINSYEVNHREVLQFNFRDISSLVAAERERDELAARLSHYLSTSPTVTYSLQLQEGVARWQWVSENIYNLLGYTSEEALAPDWWFRNIKATDRGSALAIISDLSKRETAYREYRFTKKNRDFIWLRDEMRLVSGRGQESEIVGTLTDISERKKAEEEIHLKSTALDAAANAVIITDRAGVIQWANAAYGTLTGYSSAEVVGRNPRELLKSGVQNAEFYHDLWETILSGKAWSGILVNRRKSGELYTEEMTITPVLDEAHYVNSFVAIKSDITERERSRQELETALREKSELLREIHHRVNNNMQVIVSLLNISSQDIGDVDIRAKLEDITRRMLTMAIIHEQFYESEDMSRIDFRLYVKHLLTSLKSDYPESSRNMTIAGEKGEVLLSLDQAIPAGLIVSELLTNALKFAFPDGPGIGAICVTLRISGNGMLEIEVRDNGIGLPPDIDPGSARSLGMVLIRILSEQLSGSVEFIITGGTQATLRFPIVSYTL
jgi:PAS domain S-box-containing protein